MPLPPSLAIAYHDNITDLIRPPSLRPDGRCTLSPAWRFAIGAPRPSRQRTFGASQRHLWRTSWWIHLDRSSLMCAVERLICLQAKTVKWMASQCFPLLSSIVREGHPPHRVMTGRDLHGNYPHWRTLASQGPGLSGPALPISWDV